MTKLHAVIEEALKDINVVITDIVEGVQIDANIVGMVEVNIAQVASDVVFNIQPASGVVFDIKIAATDITVPIKIESSAVTLPISIQESTITLEVKIASSAVNLPVDIVAQTIGNIKIDIAAQSLGNLDVNIAASAVTLPIKIESSAVTLDINVAGQAVDLKITNAVDPDTGNPLPLKIDLAAQSITLDINIASTAITLPIKIESSAVTLDVNLKASEVTLDVNIASAERLDINIVGGGGSKTTIFNIFYAKEWVQYNTTISDGTSIHDLTQPSAGSLTYIYSKKGHLYGVMKATVKLGTLPTDGAKESFGFSVAWATDAVCFYMSGSSFYAVCKKNNVSTTVDITSSLPSNADTTPHHYYIYWYKDRCEFWIDNNKVAEITTNIPDIPLPLYFAVWDDVGSPTTMQIRYPVAYQPETLSSSLTNIDVNIKASEVTLNINIVSSVPLSSAPPKPCLAFGGDDYVEISDFLGELSEMTVEAYVYSHVLERQALVSQEDYNCWRLFLTENGTIVFGIKDTAGTYYAVEGTPSESYKTRWIHVVGVYRGTSMEVWADGQLLASADTAGNNIRDSTAPVLIAATWTGSSATLRWFLKGSVAFVRIYTRALSADEIQHNYSNPNSPVTNGLVLWLNFDEGTGTVAHDKSGNGNDGTIHGATWVSAEGKLSHTVNVNISATQVTLDVNIKASEAVLNINLKTAEATVNILAPSGKAVSVGHAKTGTTYWDMQSVAAGDSLVAVDISGRGRIETIGLYFWGYGGQDVFDTYARITIEVDGAAIIDHVAPWLFDLMNGQLLIAKADGVVAQEASSGNPKGGAVWRSDSGHQCGIFISFPIEFTSRFRLIIYNTHDTETLYTSGIVAYGAYP